MPPAEKPIRLLSALQERRKTPRPPPAPPRSPAKKGWLWAAALGLIGVPALMVAVYSSSTDSDDVLAAEAPMPVAAAPAPTPAVQAPPVVVADATVPETAASGVLAAATAASAPLVEATTPAVIVTGDAASAPVNATALASHATASTAATTTPVGPAKIESPEPGQGLAALPGMAAATQAVAAQRAGATAAPTPAAAPVKAAAVPAAASAPGTANAAHSQPAAAPRRSSTSNNVKGGESSSKSPAKTGTTQARAKPASPSDPDAELVAAIMAHLESPRGERSAKAANERASTIAALVRDCNALPDSASALACRRRICDGYWGKAQACPRSMAPPRTAAAAAPAAQPTAPTSAPLTASTNSTTAGATAATPSP